MYERKGKKNIAQVLEWNKKMTICNIEEDAHEGIIDSIC